MYHKNRFLFIVNIIIGITVNMAANSQGYAPAHVFEDPDQRNLELLTVTNDGKYLITYSAAELASDDIIVWNLEKKEVQYIFTLPYQEQHPELLDVTDLLVSADNRYLIASGYTYTAKIWDMETGELFRTIHSRSFDIFDSLRNSQQSGEIRETSLTQDGKVLLTLDTQGILQTWDLESGQEQIRWTNGERYSNCCLLNDGKTMWAAYAGGGEGSEYGLFDLETGAILKLFEGVFSTIDEERKIIITKSSRPNPAEPATIPPDYKTVIEIRDLSTHEILEEYETDTKHFFSTICLTPDGQYLILGDSMLVPPHLEFRGQTTDIVIIDRKNSLVYPIENIAEHIPGRPLMYESDDDIAFIPNRNEIALTTGKKVYTFSLEGRIKSFEE